MPDKKIKKASVARKASVAGLKTAAAKKAAQKATGKKKAAPKTPAPTKAAPRKAAPKQAAPKKAAPTKAAPTKAAPTKAAPKKAAPTKAAPIKAEPTKAAPTKVAPTKAAPTKVAPTKAAPTKAAPTKAAPTKAAPTKAAPTKAAPTKAAPTKAAPTKAAPRTRKAPSAERAAAPPAGTASEGFFVARVAGEDAVRDAPRPMLEGAFEEEAVPEAPDDEGLGDLPWTYGDDTLVALPRDPQTLFLYWDHAHATLAGGFDGLDHPRAQVWLFVLGAGWERVRVIEFALEARGYYVHDLEPGRTYRAEIHLVDRRGQERLLTQGSNPTALPAVGPSPVVDDRFVAIPWDLPLPTLVGAGAPGGPFPESLRALLARLSDWGRFQVGGAGRGAGGVGGRPTSPPGGGGQGARPSSPSSPFGPFDGGGR
ncbi:MAG: DUF4912 domain-containing protein [Anaeromyxobacter sp.]|nr:DUF4912 domain-containing protein [Anaeromyxobacter sp.]